LSLILKNQQARWPADLNFNLNNLVSLVDLSLRLLVELLDKIVKAA
jgi:hypothetical protein